mmetsp:Transcript_41319/g.113930  ORF Transcript_41319/g.113930 Transcript_41319/m.113930 type:complete len:211 (+) Transcript_41319:736-1368(+)
MFVRAFYDSELTKRCEVGKPRIASRRQRSELRKVTIHPPSLCAEGKELTVLRPIHVCHTSLRPDLDPFALDFLPILHTDYPDTIIACRCDFPGCLAGANAIEAILMVLYRGQLLRNFLHLGTDNDNVAEGESDDEVAISEPTIAFYCTILHLERELCRFLNIPEIDQQQCGLSEDGAHGLVAGLVRIVVFDLGELDKAWLAFQAQRVIVS